MNNISCMSPTFLHCLSGVTQINSIRLVQLIIIYSERWKYINNIFGQIYLSLSLLGCGFYHHVSKPRFDFDHHFCHRFRICSLNMLKQTYIQTNSNTNNIIIKTNPVKSSPEKIIMAIKRRQRDYKIVPFFLLLCVISFFIYSLLLSVAIFFILIFIWRYFPKASICGIEI